MTTGPVVVVADANLAPLRAEFEAALPPGTEVRWLTPQDTAAILLRRRFLRQDTALRRGVWASPAYDPALPWTESPAAATVGYGHIGRAADIAGNIPRLVAGEPLRNVVAVAR